MGAVAENIDVNTASVRPLEGATQNPDSHQTQQLVDQLNNRHAPVFRHTLNSLLQFQEKPNASIPKIVDILRMDPGYSQRLFSIVNEKLEDVHRDEVNSLQHAILVLGIPQVITIGHELPLLEDLSDEHIKAQIYRCFNRSYHAGVQAREWLKERGKTTSEAAFFSAQLRDTYLASLWFHAGDQLSALLETSNIPSLCFSDGLLNHVGRQLAKKNHLPKILQQSFSYETADTQLTKTISFACAVSQLAENGWYTKEMQALIEQAVDWFGQSEELIQQKLHQHAVLMARECTDYPVRPAAARLVELQVSPCTLAKIPPSKTAARKSAPIDKEFSDQLGTLLSMGKSKNSPQKILKFSFEILSGMPGNKAGVFFLLDKARNNLKSRSTTGLAETLSPIIISIDEQNIFKRLMQKQQSVWVNQDNRKDFSKRLPGNLKINIQKNDFAAMSLFVNNKPVGLFYAELEPVSPKSVDCYKKLIALCKATRISMEEVQKNAKSE